MGGLKRPGGKGITEIVGREVIDVNDKGQVLCRICNIKSDN